MLTRLHVHGYKALREISVDFEPLTVIVGPNGCGKTSVLETIDLLRGHVTSNERGLKSPFTDDQRSKGGKRESIEVELTAVDPDEPESPVHASLSWDLSGGVRSTRVPPALFRQVRRLTLDVGALAQESYSNDPEPAIGNDGAGLATVLNWLQGERDERFDRIEHQLRRLVPEVRRIRTRRISIKVLETADVKTGEDHFGDDIYEKRSYHREEVGHQVVLDYEHADDVPAPHASEGTLLLLGLLTAIHTSDVSVLLLDDIERGLHPKSQQQLVGHLREMTEQGIQIIATSHSPYLLLHLDYDQVRAMTLDGAHGSRIGKLSEHPQFERWKDEMSPSEFWTVFGEDWLREHGKGE